MVIQIVVTLAVVLLVIPSIYSSYKKNIMTPFGALIWIFFWILGLVVIWFPEIIGFIGNLLGVARSIDALVYISIVYLLYVSLTQKIRINEINKEITMLNRRLALKDIEKDEREK